MFVSPSNPVFFHNQFSREADLCDIIVSQEWQLQRPVENPP